MGARRTVAQTTESNGKEAAGKIVRPHAAAPRRGKAGQSEATGPNAGPAFQPHPGYPPYLRCVPLIGHRSGTGGHPCRARNPPGMATGAAPLRACPAANAQIIANITADCDLIISHLPSVSKPDPLYQR